MDGMSYFGRDFVTEPEVVTADRRAMRVAMGLTLAVMAVALGAVLVLSAMGLALPGVEEFSSMPVGA